VAYYSAPSCVGRAPYVRSVGVVDRADAQSDTPGALCGASRERGAPAPPARGASYVLARVSSQPVIHVHQW